MKISKKKAAAVTRAAIERAKQSASHLRLNNRLEEKLAKAATSDIPSMLSNHPDLSKIDNQFGCHAAGSIVFVDLRQSSRMYRDRPAYDSYLSIHGLIALLTHITVELGGSVGGFRGDGLFSVFSPLFTDDFSSIGSDVYRNTLQKGVQNATKCGFAMTALVGDILNPILRSERLGGNLVVGAGVDAGHFLMTRMGMNSANELTPIGDVVNTAAKICDGHRKVKLTGTAHDFFPKSKTGKVKFNRIKIDGHPNSLFVADYSAVDIFNE